MSVNKKTKKVVKKATKHTDDNSGYVAFLLSAIVIFIIILISTIFSDAMQIYNNRRETERLREEYSMLLEKETSLRSEVIKLQDPDYVARYAREKFLYTKDGEKILRIVDGNVIPEQKTQVLDEEKEAEEE